MADRGTVLVVGGTAGLGRVLAEYLVDQGRRVVVTSRDQGRAEAVADEIGSGTTAAG